MEGCTVSKKELEEEKPVTITKKRYLELLESEHKLSALEGSSVDNWDGYEDAMQLFEEIHVGYKI